MKRWRCDLTALSHVYNLYFVACNDEIWVYEPSFPLQTLGEPAWILTVPASGVPAPPGIDDVDPHSITRICVDFLGNEEVILCTCDDGDMAGWRVREIVSAPPSILFVSPATNNNIIHCCVVQALPQYSVLTTRSDASGYLYTSPYSVC